MHFGVTSPKIKKPMTTVVIFLMLATYAASESFIMRPGEHLDFEFFSTTFPQKVCFSVEATRSFAFEYGTLSNVEYQRWKSQNFTRTFVFNYVDGGKCTSSGRCDRAFLSDAIVWLVVRQVGFESELVDIKSGLALCPTLTLPATTRTATTTGTPIPTTTSTASASTTITTVATVTTVPATGESRTLAAGFFEFVKFTAPPNKTQTGVCFDVTVVTSRALASVDIGILTAAEFARWSGSNFTTNYMFVGGTFCNDELICKKEVIVPDVAPVLLVHNTDVVPLTVTVKTQEASCPEQFTTLITTLPSVDPLDRTSTLASTTTAPASTAARAELAPLIIMMIGFWTMNQ